MWRSSRPAILLFPLLSGCNGPQSALQPAGIEAERVAALFWWMTGGGILIWLVVMGLFIYATHIRRHKEHSVRRTRWLILGGGIIFPTVVLAALLVYGLILMAQLRDFSGTTLKIAVSGEQWWWRVRYAREDGSMVELANEIRLPVGERVAFELSSPDVIHAFWIPSLGGKVDMIPGRTTQMILEPTKPGTYLGACAEYCGSAHALMKFDVVVMEKAAFAEWLERQAAPAKPPQDATAQQGLQAFLANGCGACHSVRGTEARGQVGPDLTHAGSRLSLGAGTLPTNAETFSRWIGHTDQLKPDVRMPAFGMLPADQLAAMARYLSELE
ncbi:cytochrome c oxidase subunit II [Azomonas macrocytogenes]|uniref:Cytochrome aa3 subunit 2 n=1 Tax=Azomonas macrocytogenes TaxID=69962 RepID=A0A839T709_AZOMA|nr:cytochrome c oxidase subunit II [Azomonas macrocytogenes]MBB3104236.1 cytochrome c oxidase subunit 2 [Azomonas macrocytogenes]